MAFGKNIFKSPKTSIAKQYALRRAASAPVLPLSSHGSNSLPTSQGPGTSSGRGTRLLFFILVILSIFQLINVGYVQKRSKILPKTAWTELERNLSADGVASQVPFHRSEGSFYQHLRIPRIIHYLNDYMDDDNEVASSYYYWKKDNPGWELRFYDVADLEYLVGRWWPKYLSVYRAIAEDGEKYDFFRYLTILRHGGIFVQSSSKYKKPLIDILDARDSMIVVWDREWEAVETALERCFVRRKQLQHRVFAGVAGHPLLQNIVDEIVISVESPFQEPIFSDRVLESMERTGAGVFTKLALQYAKEHPPALVGDEWPIRFLPRETIGSTLVQNCSLKPLHYDLERYKPDQFNKLDFDEAQLQGFKFSTDHDSSENTTIEPKESNDAFNSGRNHLYELHEEHSLYPVSASFDPPFDMMVHLAGHGEVHSGWDVSSELSGFGVWQPSVDPIRSPTLADALIGSLGILDGDKNSKLFVDVGAGYGFFSLAAASRGHQVRAFEIGMKSVSSFNSSIFRNGFQDLVKLHKVALGCDSESRTFCAAVESRHARPSSIANSSSLPQTKAVETKKIIGSDIESPPEAEKPVFSKAFLTTLERGYGPASLHRSRKPVCLKEKKRWLPSEILPTDIRISSLRISAGGWAGCVLQGFLTLIEKDPPRVISIEWDADAILETGYQNPLNLVHKLVKLGYKEVSHSGFLCDQRWSAITFGSRQNVGSQGDPTSKYSRQPTWCRLLPEDYSLLTENIAVESPETLLFVRR